MKTCNRCKLDKAFTEFHKNKSVKDGYQRYCKACAKQFYGTWYGRSPDAQKRYTKWKEDRIASNRVKLLEFLSDKTCVDCGVSDYRVLDFDHVRGQKLAGIANLIHQGSTWDKILLEISKCEVRCSNCHRIVTGERGNWWWTAKEN